MPRARLRSRRSPAAATPSGARICHSSTTSARVEVSSSEMPTCAASTRRRFAISRRACVDAGGALSGGDGQRIEKRVVDDGQAELPEPGGEHAGQAVHPGRDRRQSPRPVVDGVHRRHHGEQHLRGADVRGRLLAADVLLARLQREPVRRRAVAVDASRRPAVPGRLRLNSSRVAKNAACGPPKPIGTPKRWLEPTTTSAPHSPGGTSSVSASRSVATRTSAPRACNASASAPIVAHVAVDARVLEQRRKAVRVRCRRGRADDHRKPKRRGARAHHVDGLRQNIVGEVDASSSCSCRPAAPSAIASAAAVASSSMRGVGDGQTGQIAHHGLEVDQRLEASLRDLRPGRACRPCTRPGSRARCAGSLRG